MREQLRNLLLDCAAEKGISLEELGEKAGVDRRTLSNWFSGVTKKPRNACVKAVAEFLDVDRKDILRHFEANPDRPSTEKTTLTTMETPHFSEHTANPKSYSIDNIEVEDAYLVTGNYTKPLSLSVEYYHEPIILDNEIAKIYSHLAEQEKKKAILEGYDYFNGPNTRLLRVRPHTIQGGDGYEESGLILELGPVSWEEYSVLNTHLGHELGSGLTIREMYADRGKIFRKIGDFRWCKLSNLLPVTMIPITSDGYGIVQFRNPNRVSSFGNLFHGGFSENIHRFLDEAPKDKLDYRIHELRKPKDVSHIVDENYSPTEGVPSPLLTAQRGLHEEFSEMLALSLETSAYKFLNICFELTYSFHPELLGVVDLGVTRHEADRMRRVSPGKDHSEAMEFVFVDLGVGNDETQSLMAQTSRWFPVGLAALITAIGYWRHVSA